MPTPEIEILFPEKEITLPRGGKIVVRELNHRKATQFLTMVAKYVPKIFGEDGKPNVTVQAVVDLASSTEELSNFLIEESTGVSPDLLPTSVSLEVLHVALELNLSEEILAKGKALAGLFQGLAAKANPGGGRPAAASAKSTTSSAKAATTSA